MTDHPLTDDIAESIAVTELQCPFGIGQLVFTHDDMRAAFDKGRDHQLEQVIEWIQANLWLYDDETGPMYIKEDFLSDKVIDEEKVIEDLKKAMRPQEES